MICEFTSLMQRMDVSKITSIIGLILNTLASIILMLPYIIGNHYVDDDYIEDMDMKTSKFIQRKHLTERKNNLFGLGFMGAGFVFQIISVVT